MTQKLGYPKFDLVSHFVWGLGVVRKKSTKVKLNLRELNNIVLARTSDNLVRAGFSSIKVFITLDLRSYYAIDASDF